MQSNCRIMVPRFYTFEGLGQNTLNQSAYRRGCKSMKGIRTQYGSSIIKTEQQAALTAN